MDEPKGGHHPDPEKRRPHDHEVFWDQQIEPLLRSATDTRALCDSESISVKLNKLVELLSSARELYVDIGAAGESEADVFEDSDRPRADGVRLDAMSTPSHIEHEEAHDGPHTPSSASAAGAVAPGPTSGPSKPPTADVSAIDGTDSNLADGKAGDGGIYAYRISNIVVSAAPGQSALTEPLYVVKVGRADEFRSRLTSQASGTVPKCGKLGLKIKGAAALATLAEQEHPDGAATDAEVRRSGLVHAAIKHVRDHGGMDDILFISKSLTSEMDAAVAVQSHTIRVPIGNGRRTNPARLGLAYEVPFWDRFLQLKEIQGVKDIFVGGIGWSELQLVSESRFAAVRAAWVAGELSPAWFEENPLAAKPLGGVLLTLTRTLKPTDGVPFPQTTTRDVPILRLTVDDLRFLKQPEIMKHLRALRPRVKIGGKKKHQKERLKKHLMKAAADEP